MEHVSAAADTAKALGLEHGLLAGDRVWIAHPVDIRFSLPMPFGRYYLTLVAGPERRSAARREDERQYHPLTTLGNFLFFFASALAINATVLVAFLVYTSVLRF